MSNKIQIHYLEIVTPEVEQTCTSYSRTLGVSFSDAIAELGGARTAIFSSGGTLGVRAPMHEGEEPTTRPYYLVSDLEDALEEADLNGAEILVPSMDIPGRGKCAILMNGTIQSGLWQV